MDATSGLASYYKPALILQAKQTTVSEERKAKRQSVFQPPVSEAVGRSHGAGSGSEEPEDKVDLSAMKKKFSKALNKVRY